MKSKKSVFFAGAAVLIIVSAAIIYRFQDTNAGQKRECPEHWVEDRMPTTEGNAGERQYFIINNERKEVKDYDINWIRGNCSVQLEYTY